MKTTTQYFWQEQNWQLVNWS